MTNSADVRRPAPEMDSILLIGQSNMCGRGIIGHVPPIDPEDAMFMLRNGRWQPMSEPINPDRRIFVEHDTDFRSGVSLAASFAQDYAHTLRRRVGLIPCADGGTKLAQWQPGELLFDHAVMQSRLAQRTSIIRGILWHQGESDSVSMQDVEAYEERFFRMYGELCRELCLDETTPFILGEISLMTKRFTHAEEINRILHRIAGSQPQFGIARAADLPLSPDGIHFSAASYRILGQRYFAEYQKALSRIKASPANACK